MAKTYGDKKTMERERPVYKAFKSGSYIAKLTVNEVKEKTDYNRNVVPTLCLQFSPYEANARTATMKDVDGETIKPLSRRLFMDINKITMGFRDNFTIPSKYRSLVAALQMVDPNEEVEGPDELTVDSAHEQLEEFIGKYVIVNVVAFEKKDVWRNKITDFQLAPDDFTPDPVIEAQFADQEKKKAENPKGSDSDTEEEAVEMEEETSADKPKDTKKALF